MKDFNEFVKSDRVFKTLEGKLNTFIIMQINDKKTFTIKDLVDCIHAIPSISEREKIHLAISAMLTLKQKEQPHKT